MKLIQSEELINVFNLLNESKLNYILLRNIDNELPISLTVGKDIDILVHKKDEKEFIDFFNTHKYQKIKHPHENNIFLYGVNKFQFIHNKFNNILFDLNFQIAVRSLDSGQWIPLDQIIQESAWENRRFEKVDDKFGYWTLSYNDEFITLLARSIFDKREFQQGYINRINELYSKIDIDDVVEKLNMVFFKFTPYLLEMIENKDFDNIINKYLTFKEY